MDFEQRLEKAVARGAKRGAGRAEAESQRALTEEELKRLHSDQRLALSEHIEACVSKLTNHFPGFRSETVMDERGWGAAVSRDDFSRGGATGRQNVYSRLEMTVRPFSSLHVLELAAKGTIRNKEIFHRTHFQPIPEVELEKFLALVETWSLEYAELYAAKS